MDDPFIDIESRVDEARAQSRVESQRLKDAAWKTLLPGAADTQTSNTAINAYDAHRRKLDSAEIGYARANEALSAMARSWEEQIQQVIGEIESLKGKPEDEAGAELRDIQTHLQSLVSQYEKAYASGRADAAEAYAAALR